MLNHHFWHYSAPDDAQPRACYARISILTHSVEIRASSWRTSIFKAVEIVDDRLAHQRIQVGRVLNAKLCFSNYILIRNVLWFKVTSKETVWNSWNSWDSWDILNAILGHKYHQNHSKTGVTSSEWSQHLQQKWLWSQSVNGWVRSTRSTVFADISTQEACSCSETRPSLEVGICTLKDTKYDQTHFSVANFGFIHFVWPCLVDSDDICDLSQVMDDSDDIILCSDLLWRIKCPRTEFPTASLDITVYQFVSSSSCYS